MNHHSIPIFPLQTVLFPGGYLPLRIFEQRYIDMVRDCSASGGLFGVCLVNKPESEEQAPGHSRVGTTAEICDFSTLEDGLLGIVARGRRRFLIQNTRMRDNALLMAEVKLLDESETVEVKEEFSVLSMVAAKFMELLGDNYPDFQPGDLQDADWLGYRLSELLPLDNREKQMLLEVNEPLDRLQVLLELMPRFQETESEC